VSDELEGVEAALQKAIRDISLDYSLIIEITHTGRLHYTVRYEHYRTGDGMSFTGMTLVEALQNAIKRRYE
jgi:hypothetical protein